MDQKDSTMLAYLTSCFKLTHLFITNHEHLTSLFSFHASNIIQVLPIKYFNFTSSCEKGDWACSDSLCGSTYVMGK